MKSGYRGTLTAAALALATACVFAAPALAQDTSDDECVAACREDLMNCRFDAREANQQCLEEAGCGTLREAYREACFIEDRDEDACDAARQALRDCVEPCRMALRDDSGACREDLVTCLADDCGLAVPPFRQHRHDHRGRGPRR